MCGKGLTFRIKLNSKTCTLADSKHSNQRNNTMQCVEKNKAADGRHADSYSQCAGGRGSVSPLATELCVDLGVNNMNLNCSSNSQKNRHTNLQTVTHNHQCSYIFYRLKGLRKVSISMQSNMNNAAMWAFPLHACLIHWIVNSYQLRCLKV